MEGTIHPLVWGTALASFSAVLAIGAWAAARTRTSADFFVAGQRIGLWVTGLATTTAAFSGFVFLGGPGLTYQIGTAALLICLPVSYTAVLSCRVVGIPLRRAAGEAEILTIPDAARHRYRSRAVAGVTAVAVLVGSVSYLAAQVQALGILVEVVFGLRTSLGPWSAPVAVVAGLVVVLFYSTAGGMVAGVYTDVLQGILMAGAAVAVAVVGVAAAGGLGATVDAIVASPDFGAAFFDPLRGTVPPLVGLGFLFVFGVGVLGQPHMLHKFFMIREPRSLRWLPLVVATSQSAVILVWIGLGLAIPALVAQGLMPAPGSPDDATPLFLVTVAPPVVAAAVLAAALAAIMSTADSLLNLGAAALVRDLPRSFGRSLRDELRWARWATVGLGIVAALFAFLYGDLIALLGTFAFGTFAAALTPAFALGLHWPGATAKGAVASIAGGTVLNVGLEALRRAGALDLGGLPPAALALAVSTLLFVGVSVAESEWPE